MMVAKGLTSPSPDNKMGDEDVDEFMLSPELYICETSHMETISGAIYILIFVFSITGNTLVLGVLLYSKKLKDVTSLFFLNLACSDLVFTLTLPFWAYYHLHHWVFGEYGCKFATATYNIGIYSSIILLTAMTVDRFITVVLQWPRDPVKRRRFALISCTAAWIISAAGSVNDARNVNVQTKWNLSSCLDLSESPEVEVGYYLHVSLLFFLPFTIIVFCYSFILKTILQVSNRKPYRTVGLILCIVAFFFICWGSFNIVLLIMSFYKPQSCDAKDKLYMVYSVCRILAYSHCCVTPMLYMIPETFRKHICSVLCCRNSKRNVMRERREAAGQSINSMLNAAYTVQNSAVIL